MATETVGRVTLLNVRLSFASLFEPNKQTAEDGTTRENWKSNFLFAKKDSDAEGVYKGKRMPLMKALQMANEDAKEKKWGSKEKWPKLKPEKVYLRDGDLEDWDGYAGNYYISSNAAIADRPSVVTNRKDKDGKWMKAEPGAEGAPYSGCYVNATIEVWGQDNEHGKRMNSKLKAVQFRANGEPFGAAPVDPNEEFSDDMVSDEGSIAEDYGDDEDIGGLV